MTMLPREPATRRSYLKRIGIAAAAIGGLSSPAVASSGDTLAGTPGFFSVYYSTEDDPSDPDDFGFSEDPFIMAPNPNGDGALFDSSGIRISPDRNTLHHDLQVFAGLVMEDKPKPYTLVNEGDGVFESRGQTVNFTARSTTELEEMLASIGLSPNVASVPPLSTLAGGKWRAVATEQLKIDLTGEPPFDYEWAATRVDFYTRGDESAEHSLTLIYVLWADPEGVADFFGDPDCLENFWSSSGCIGESDHRSKAEDKALELVESGLLNLGGQ